MFHLNMSVTLPRLQVQAKDQIHADHETQDDGTMTVISLMDNTIIRELPLRPTSDGAKCKEQDPTAPRLQR
jgi:hypothetical protein